MAKLTVLKFPDPRLKDVAKEVAEFNTPALQQKVDDMLETMYDLEGVGLAATQVAITERIVVIDCSKERNQPMVVINPVLTKQEGTIFWEEGCLSFPGVYAKVRRHEHVEIKYQDQFGKEHILAAEGLLGVCFQHETDHLNGITFYDHLSTLKQKLLKSKLNKMDRNQS